MNYRRTYVIALCCVLQCVGQLAQAMTCTEAQQSCTMYTGCSAALHSYFISCVGFGPRPVNGSCSTACTEALMSLMTTELGEEFVKCDCEDNENHERCAQQKRRMQPCTTGVLEAMDKLRDDTPMRCSLATLMCDAETTCYTALSYTYKKCATTMINGISCSAECNRSLDILYKLERGKKLKHCVCEKDDVMQYGRTSKSTCEQVKYNEARLCFGQIIEVIPLTDTTTKVPNGGNNLQVTRDSVATHSLNAALLLLSLAFYFVSVNR